MKTSKNTVLITGGSAGIGLEIAKKLDALGNHVIIVGRNAERLKAAAAQLNHVTTLTADVSDANDTDELIKTVSRDFPALNMVINNAGAAFLSNLTSGTDTFKDASAEMLTNYLAIIRLNEGLLALLQQQAEAAIVNVSSIVAFVPGDKLVTYGASKAALHSYTLSLRRALESTTVKVFELMPPLVNTEFSAVIDGHKGIPASQVAEEFLEGWQTDRYEIRVANTEQLYQLFRSSPEEALKVMNQPR